MSVRPSAEGYYEVQAKNNQWYRLRLISDVTFSPTPAPETTETTLDEGEVTTVGSPGTPTYSVTVSLNDASLAYRTLETAFYDKSTVNQRQVVGQPSVNALKGEAGDTLTLAVSGVITGAGNLSFGTSKDPTSPWIPGRLLCLEKANNANLVADDIIYIIESITDAANLVVSRVGAVTSILGDNAVVTPDEEDLEVVAGGITWRLMDYGILETWGGRVTQAGSPTRSGTTRNETIQGNTESRPSKVYLVPVTIV